MCAARAGERVAAERADGRVTIMQAGACKQSIEAIAARYPDRRSALLPALHLVQRAGGGHRRPRRVSRTIAELIGVPVSDGLRRPDLLHHVRPRAGRPLPPAGRHQHPGHAGRRRRRSWPTSSELAGHPRRARPPSDGLFTLSTVEDLASCGTCPVIQVNDRYYESMTAGADRRPAREPAPGRDARPAGGGPLRLARATCCSARRGMPNATEHRRLPRRAAATRPSRRRWP